VARNAEHRFPAEVLLDERQSKVNSSSNAAGCIHIPVTEKEEAGVDFHRWIRLCKALCIYPMRGNTPTMKKTRGGQNEGARAN
jgi:hypothetical protein